MKMATDMKPIAFTMEQLEYVFNFGTTFKLIEGAMIEEARELGDTVKCCAMMGFFPVLENSSLIIVSTIINRIHQYSRIK